jgi:hypothetical protein
MYYLYRVINDREKHMNVFIKHETATLFYAVNTKTNTVEICCPAFGREKVERNQYSAQYALSAGNALITEAEYQTARRAAMVGLGMLETSPKKELAEEPEPQPSPSYSITLNGHHNHEERGTLTSTIQALYRPSVEEFINDLPF